MRCYEYFAERGVGQFSYFHFPPIGAIDHNSVKIIVWMGYPEAWVDAYRQAGYVEKDPAVLRLLKENRPAWTSALLRAPDAGPPEEQYLKRLNACGVKDDLGVPVFGPGGRNGGYGIGFHDDAPDLTPADINEIHWICQTAHLRYCELLDEALEKSPKLSSRETEVLQQIALGKTNTQIAKDMSVSAKTVETYLSRIFFKLDVHDRMTAALRAISNGVI